MTRQLPPLQVLVSTLGRFVHGWCPGWPLQAPQFSALVLVGSSQPSLASPLQLPYPLVQLPMPQTGLSPTSVHVATATAGNALQLLLQSPQLLVSSRPVSQPALAVQSS